MKTGILIDDDFELQITSGSLTIGDSGSQNQTILLLAGKGELKEHPQRGVGIRTYIESENIEDLAREIRTEFSLDGMKVEKININIPEVEIVANYAD